MTAWQVQTATMGGHTIYIAYEYDAGGFTGRHGYVNGYGEVPTVIYGRAA